MAFNPNYNHAQFPEIKLGEENTNRLNYFNFDEYSFEEKVSTILKYGGIVGESDELDHLNPEQIDQGIRSKLTTHFRTKLTTLIRAN